MKSETKKLKKCSGRKACKECPWINNNRHSQSWPGYVDSMASIGQIEGRKHACHMITSDTWGYDSDINESNVCIGSLQVNGDLR